jgi:antitoxin component YwqK of YwqJK toxin-antitoxin module
MKKWIALSLALILVLSLCACSESGKKDESDKKGDSGEDRGVVTTGKLTEVVEVWMPGTEYTFNHKATIEYDDDNNVIGTKIYYGGRLDFEATYDKDIDKPLLELVYDKDGKVNDRTEYTYDTNGNCLERNTTSTNSDGETKTYKYVYTYDGYGNLLTQKQYVNGELSLEDCYTYDSHGNRLSWYCSGYDGPFQVIYQNTYDKGKLTEVKAYRDGKLNSYSEYDADGNEILSISYHTDNGEEAFRCEYTYENGKLMAKVFYHEGEPYREEYTYNAAGKLTEYKSSNRGYGIAYDVSGNPTDIKYYENDELRSEYTLTYENVTVSKEMAEKLETVVAVVVGML